MSAGSWIPESILEARLSTARRAAMAEVKEERSLETTELWQADRETALRQYLELFAEERGKAFDAGVSACAALLMLTGDEAAMRLTMDERRRKAVEGDW